jgi:hypothetical protein
VPQTPLPPQKVVLTVTRNKIQLIDMVCEQLINIYQQHHSDDEHRLVIMDQNEVPVEVHKEGTSSRRTVVDLMLR